MEQADYTCGLEKPASFPWKCNPTLMPAFNAWCQNSSKTVILHGCTNACNIQSNAVLVVNVTTISLLNSQPSGGGSCFITVLALHSLHTSVQCAGLNVFRMGGGLLLHISCMISHTSAYIIDVLWHFIVARTLKPNPCYTEEDPGMVNG